MAARLFSLILFYEPCHRIGVVGFYNYIGRFLNLWQSVAHGNGYIGNSEHGQVVEVVAENYKAFGAEFLLQPFHGFGLVNAGWEYLEIVYVFVEYIGITAYRAFRVCRLYTSPSPRD